MALLCNDVSHWLGASLESALHYIASRVDPALSDMFVLTGEAPWWNTPHTKWVLSVQSASSWHALHGIIIHGVYSSYLTCWPVKSPWIWLDNWPVMINLKRWEDTHYPFRNVLRTICRNDVTIGVCLASQYHNQLTHYKQQGRGNWSMGLFIELSVL